MWFLTLFMAFWVVVGRWAFSLSVSMFGGLLGGVAPRVVTWGLQGLPLCSVPSSFASNGATSVAPLASYQKANMDNGEWGRPSLQDPQGR